MPASGKGTQAEYICEHFNFLHIGAGDILRQEKETDSEYAQIIKEYTQEGKLLPDDIMTKIVKKFLNEKKDNLLFDGFPRTVQQAEILEEFLELHLVIDIEIADDEAMKRISSRRVCKNGHSFSLLTHPPKKEGICDFCEEKLFQRQDDNETTIKNRLKVYKEQTEPLLIYFNERVRKIDGQKSIEHVFQDIKKIIAKEINT